MLFTGRFQHDLAMVEADQGDWRESNIRRVRFGPRITLFRDFLVHAEIEVNPQERNPFYLRLTDAYVAWQKNPKAVITVGKQSIPFTQEGATSSKELITIDRSNLANNIWFTQEYMPGVSVSGRVGAVDLSRRHLFVRRDESRVRPLQRRHVHAGARRL